FCEMSTDNQVWAMDITYLPMARGFVYLAVVLDWFSRRLLARRLPVTMEASLCVEVLEDALAHNCKPEIVNTDQGAQFTGSAIIGVLTKHSIAISMDGQGAWRDNVFVSSGCGAPSNTRRYTCELMTASATHALRSDAICTSIMSDARMRALTASDQ